MPERQRAMRHPDFRLDAAQPIGQVRNSAAAVLQHMLLAHIAHGNPLAGRVGEGLAEHAFAFEDALGMVAQGTMPEIGELLLGGIEPAMNRQVIFRLAAELSCGGFRVVIRCSHGYLLKGKRRRYLSRAGYEYPVRVINEMNTTRKNQVRRHAVFTGGLGFQAR